MELREHIPDLLSRLTSTLLHPHCPELTPIWDRNIEYFAAVARTCSLACRFTDLFEGVNLLLLESVSSVVEGLSSQVPSSLTLSLNRHSISSNYLYQTMTAMESKGCSDHAQRANSMCFSFENMLFNHPGLRTGATSRVRSALREEIFDVSVAQRELVVLLSFWRTRCV